MRRITLQQIEAFYWSATLGSVGRAADRLGLSQPAVSLRLKEFQAGTGIELFERVGRQLRPSLQAREMVRAARAVLDQVDDLHGSGQRGTIGGKIRVGFAEGVALACLPQVLDLLHRRHPDLHPELTVGISSSIEPSLHDSRLDLAFLVEPGEQDGFTYVYLGQQPTSWVASPQLIVEGSVTPTDLQRVRVIANQPGTIGYRQVVRWFASQGLQPGFLDICSSVAIQAKLIEAGTGVGILPVKMVEDKIEQGALKVLETFPPVPPVSVFLVHRTDALGRNARAFVDCVTDTLADMNYLV